MVIYRLFSIRLAACLLSSLSLLLCSSDAWISKAQAQVESAAGIRRFAKGQWTIVTDLPIDSELESWPVVLDQALASWCQKWSIAPEVAKSWPLTIHCMADRKVFERAGLLDGVPAFEDGFQLADRVFLNEQPSTYYRRHLLLHEATHWVMYRALSGGGSPWFMEGMAEVEGTHRLKDGVLTLAIIPDDRQEVPHWGRFKRLSDSVAKNGVPTLKQILYFGNDRQDRMDRYCWSWAACVFFRNHPLYASSLQKASVAPLDYSLKLSEQLEQTLGDRWDWVERDWKVFVDEFDFGYRPNIDMISLETTQGITTTAFSGESSIQLDCSIGWQVSKCFLKAGQKVQIRADGRYVVRNQNSQTWECSADGITYQHFRHIPMGKLLGGFVCVDRDEPLMVFEIGKQTEFVAPRDGWLLLKINEPVRQRQDNAGKLDVRIES